MIDRGTVDRILDATEIVDVISDFVSLKRRGANYIACCPFHNEKTPSFSVSPSKGIFKCFGCGKAGSAVTFIMEHEQMTYNEALKYLGKKYGIEVREKEESEEDIQERLRHESLLVVSEFAQKYFADTMWNTEVGKAVGLNYFKQARGFSQEIINKFGLGYAPDAKRISREHSISSLSEEALKQGYKREFLISTGLSIERPGGELVDKFYDRVMFPIHSISGRVIAFGGRTLLSDKSVSKYVNSPESDIYHKSKSLYGIYFAKSSIVSHQKCYLVEGYTDVISFHQAGVENVVSSSGTSLTVEQIRLIKRFTNKVTVLYDGDFAGIKASIRGIDMLIEEGLDVKAALFPQGDDPDSFARSHTKEEITDFLNNAETDFISFKYNILSKDISKDPFKKADLIKEIVRTISLIPDQIIRSVYIEETSRKLDIKQEMLVHEVGKIRKHSQATPTPYQFNNNEEISENENNVTPILIPCEKELLYYLIKFGKAKMDFEEHNLYGAEKPLTEITVSQFIATELKNDDLEFLNTLYKRIFDLYYKYESEEDDNDKILRRFVNNEDKEIIKAVLDIVYEEYTINVKEFKRSLIPEINVLGSVVPKAILIYKSKITEHTYNLIMSQLQRAQKDGDIELQQELMKQIKILMMVKNQFSKELNRLF